MAKNRKNPPTSHKQKQERLAEAKERRRQAEARMEARQKQQAHASRFDVALAKHRKSRKIEDVIEAIWWPRAAKHARFQ